MRQSREAVRAAKSWQNNVTMREGGQWPDVLIEKVECPARRDLMWTIKPLIAAMDDKGRAIVHDVWFNGTWYTSDGKYWETYRTPEKKPAIGCGDGPMLVSNARLFADLDEVIGKGEIKPGPKMTENGFDCTWWDLARAAGGPPDYTVCIGTSDHLPQVVRSRENGHEYTYTLSQWNTASVGLPPELSR